VIRMPFHPDDVPYIPGERVCEEKEGSMYLILAPELPNCISVNAEARTVIDLCDGVKTIREITKELSRSVGEDPEENLSDMVGFFTYLESKKFAFKEPIKQEGPLPREPDNLEQLWLNITNECNLRCRHCHSFFGSPLKNELTTEEITNLIKEASSFKECTLVISGGEPFCRDDISKIVKAASHHFGRRVSVITNGTLIDDEKAQLLADSHVKVQISLEGPDPESNDTIRGTGVFTKAVAALRRLKKLGVDVTVRMTLLKTNKHKMREVIEFVKKEGIAPVSFELLKMGGRSLDSLENINLTTDELIQTYRQIKEFDPDSSYIGFDESLKPGVTRMVKRDLCSAGHQMLSVGADGGVYPCAGLMYPEFLAGNVRENPLDKIWKESLILNTIRRLSVSQIPECMDCPIRYLCGGGCLVDIFWEHKTLCKKTPRCAFMRAMKWDELKASKYKKKSWG